MAGPRTAMALYVALALHLVVALLIALAPGPQRPPGSRQGMGLGLQLSGPDSVLGGSEARPGASLPHAESVRLPDSRPAGKSSASVAGQRVERPDPAPRGVNGPVDAVSQTTGPHPRTGPAAQRQGVPIAAGHRINESTGPGGGALPGGGFDRYFARLRQHLSFFRRELPPGTLPGEAEVGFTVLRDGHLESLSLIRSSGDPRLDAEALDLLRRAQPLPPPGEGFRELAVPIRID